MGVGQPTQPEPLPWSRVNLSPRRSAKSAARAHYRRARAQLPAATRAAASRDIVRHLSELLRTRRPRRIAAYAPLPEEPGYDTLLDALLATPAPLLLPIVGDAGTLTWAPISSRAQLRADNPMGIAEPATPAATHMTTPAMLDTTDLVITPALALTPDGYRLGQGGGFYDRVLAASATCPAPPLFVALAFSHEISADLPIEDHDRAVAMIITPQGPRHTHGEPTPPGGGPTMV
nr:5-formyltetrahydrofolate cyclo-ligase [Corynebacterium sp. c6VSa_13]